MCRIGASRVSSFRPRSFIAAKIDDEKFVSGIVSGGPPSIASVMSNCPWIPAKESRGFSYPLIVSTKTVDTMSVGLAFLFFVPTLTGMGRPKKPAGEVRENFLRIRLTEDERAALDRAASTTARVANSICHRLECQRFIGLLSQSVNLVRIIPLLPVRSSVEAWSPLV